VAKKKVKLQYNPETLSFERIETSLSKTIKKLTIHLFSSTFVGFIFFVLFSFIIDSPEEKQLRKENEQMELQFELLNRRLEQMNAVLDDIKQRDNNLYRVIYQADSIPNNVRHNTAFNNQYYEHLTKLNTSTILIETTRKTDDISKQLYIQSKSYDDLMSLIKNNEKKLQHIPAIQPILNKDLTRIASGFGYRIDPIYRTRKFHQGMDFTAPTGTDIYTTGNGVVEFVGWKQGYGNTVILDHGFGYETLYAHLYKSLVRKGQKVRRSDIIALVGNTGKSTGPHLHYEVRLNGRPVDPRNYYFYDLSPEEYDQMIQLSNNFGHMLD
jgi:murein DD-endopeptidase MepM/ murein hydrolase activator NlpD